VSAKVRLRSEIGFVLFRFFVEVVVIKYVRCFARDALYVASLAGVTLAAETAHAHIDLDRAGSHVSRYGDVYIKSAPCGQEGGTTRGDNVYEYKPGSTIEIKISEFVHHPGYFRIAFDDDGQDFVTPVSITGEHGACAGDPKCGPGMEDFCNDATVLIDNLDPHVGGGFLAPPKEWTWKVKLPDVECDNCTLQIIQVMTDLDIHTAPYPADDIYYQCIDLVLSSEATDEGVAAGPIGGEGIDCKAAAPTAGTGGMGGAGGESGMGGAGGMTGGAGGSTAGAGGGGGAGGTAGAAGTGAGTGSVTGGAGGMTGGAGGAAGTAGVGGAGGAGGAAGTVSPGGPTSSGDDGGCSATGALTATHALGGVLPVALALIFVRRRRG
jgi:hypothetical protein